MGLAKSQSLKPSLTWRPAAGSVLSGEPQRLMQRLTLIVPLLLTLAGVLPVPASARNLEIFFIDVEGGQSTLIVTPAGQSLLIDAGYAGREARE